MDKQNHTVKPNGQPLIVSFKTKWSYGQLVMQRKCGKDVYGKNTVSESSSVMSDSLRLEFSRPEYWSR